MCASNGRTANRLAAGRSRGVLDFEVGSHWFDATQHPPPPDLAELVEHCWIVRWDLHGREPYQQHTLSNASCHLVVEPGRTRIQGVVTGRFTRLLEGAGRAFGVKFRPAGFRPFLGSPVSALADRTLPVSAVFGAGGAATVAQIERENDDDARIVEMALELVRAHRPEPDPNVPMLNGIVALIVAERSITRVDDVVERAGIGKRSLQRLFSEYVGVSPKWVIQRYRLHEAVERLDAGQHVHLAQLAVELGYFDQAHFVRDFKALVGKPPSAYTRRT
jgi:AraC-like DNA-binding protein